MVGSDVCPIRIVLFLGARPIFRGELTVKLQGGKSNFPQFSEINSSINPVFRGYVKHFELHKLTLESQALSASIGRLAVGEALKKTIPWGSLRVEIKPLRIVPLFLVWRKKRGGWK